MNTQINIRYSGETSSIRQAIETRDFGAAPDDINWANQFQDSLGQRNMIRQSINRCFYKSDPNVAICFFLDDRNITVFMNRRENKQLRLIIEECNELIGDVIGIVKSCGGKPYGKTSVTVCYWQDITAFEGKSKMFWEYLSNHIESWRFDDWWQFVGTTIVLYLVLFSPLGYFASIPSAIVGSALWTFFGFLLVSRCDYLNRKVFLNGG